MALRSIFDRPTVLAATIAGAASVGIALASLIEGSISAHFQQQSDEEKLRTELLIHITAQPEPKQAGLAAKLVGSGVLPDKDGSICMTFIGKGCPLKVLKPN